MDVRHVASRCAATMQSNRESPSDFMREINNALNNLYVSVQIRNTRPVQFVRVDTPLGRRKNK